MSVKVIYQNDTVVETEPSRLDELISLNKIKKILRSDGWASVATAPIRGRRLGYEGPERRRVPVEVLSPKNRYNLRKVEGEQLHSDFVTMHHRSRVLNRMSEQTNTNVFNCPECGGTCIEEQILDGSNVGITLMMKCTSEICWKYFRVTYDGLSWLESVTLI